jgi:hypothetical protein
MKYPCLVILAATVAPCHAGIVYDNISGNVLSATWATTESNELAQDVTLAGGGGVLQTVAVAVRNTGGGTYSGPAWVGLYESGGSVPGALLASRSTSVTLAGFQTLAVSFDFTGVNVPATFWISLNSGISVGIGAGGVPSIGSSQGYIVNRTLGTGPWFGDGLSHPRFGFRVTTIPTPASSLAFAALPGALHRKRRTTRAVKHSHGTAQPFALAAAPTHG